MFYCTCARCFKVSFVVVLHWNENAKYTGTVTRNMLLQAHVRVYWNGNANCDCFIYACVNYEYVRFDKKSDTTTWLFCLNWSKLSFQ